MQVSAQAQPALDAYNFARRPQAKEKVLALCSLRTSDLLEHSFFICDHRFCAHTLWGSVHRHDRSLFGAQIRLKTRVLLPRSVFSSTAYLACVGDLVAIGRGRDIAR